MKLLVGSILIWSTERDALGHDAQANPPHRQLRQPAESWTRERNAVVTADPLRQPILGKGTLKTPSRPRRRLPTQGITTQHESAESIPQRQRVAVDAVARQKLSFEVRGPCAIGLRDRRQRRRHADRRRRAAPRYHQSVTLQQLTHG